MDVELGGLLIGEDETDGDSKSPSEANRSGFSILGKLSLAE